MGLLDYSIFDEIRRMNARQVIYQFLNFAMIVSSALMIWKGLMVVTGSESPIVVVLSGSMEPAIAIHPS
uniref:Signal peptidase complex catalytic subunit SEC11 n=1 Tax=Acrobeloides nanus TaxID=290746 RepID=A0A914CH12_9BILA